METAANSANLMPTLKANYPWQFKVDTCKELF